MKNTATTSNSAAKSLAQNKLLIISFVEGSCVMVAELAGGKMLAPFYGTSLYVWASTLALTLGGLTIGYYLGGELSKRDLEKRQKALFTILAIASALVMIMPMLADFIMKRTMDMSFLTGVITSQFIFLLPPIMGMGMVSPLLISMIAEHNASGKAAGLVYAVSTLGGVISTLLTGFWLVPVVGISLPCIVIGALLLILTLIILKPGKKNSAAMLLLVLLIPSFFFYSTRGQQNTDKYKVLYHTEGILGQVKIVDFNYELRDKEVPARVMLVNHNWQTWIDRTNPDFSFLYYTRFTHAVISNLPPGSSALLIGLGGGTVARQLERYNVNYDAVEIDGRLPKLAEQYFGLKHAVANTAVDDGRHYINICKKRYDLIIIDALLGDNVPSHLLSEECFTKMKDLLTNNGKIFVEFDGITEEEDGTAQKLLYNTLVKAGYSTRIFSSYPRKVDYDCMFVATKGKDNNYDTAQVVTDTYFPIKGNLKKFEITDMLNNPHEEIITDNNPVLDFYLKDRVVAFRHDYLGKYNEEFMEDQMSFFK
ncbi:MAG: fused MFS/spermidine synthase [Bacteroidetes bacterium]|nr:fused MFS/spermidine synthase [Bacteroidota bacterium]